jgi:prepilin-type processing-associated H-X9-DG protein
MLLRNLERQDVWDQIVDHTLEPVILPRMDVFACPSDNDANSVADRPALSYIANTGAWDMDGSNFLGDNLPAEANKGDVAANGVMFNEAMLPQKKVPRTRLSVIKGADMTILYSENIHRTYEPINPSDPPLFSWAYGNEQQVGMVWVVNPTPPFSEQEGINRNESDPPSFPTLIPQFARPASSHNGGVNVAFCDTHVKLISDTIEYIVYQQLLTTNGSKCEDPRDHNPKLQDASPAIRAFRTAAPLSESDFE